ncbi:hypothetical protein RB195_018583 [Necator americanus]|uniref:Uncharacterized protein n=1 Tax=Necator americanus TaxID=51031 RepID=A0ABR1CCR1_NECAM
MYEVLERIILDRLIKHRDEIARDEQADQMFIVRRVIEIWQGFAIDDIVGRIVESNSPADIILEPLRRLLTDLENADDVVIFAGSITKLQHVVNLVSKLAAAYVYALINACRCASLRDLERGFGWKDN